MSVTSPNFFSFISSAAPIGVAYILATNINNLFGTLQTSCLNPLVGLIPGVNGSLANLEVTVKQGDESKNEDPVIVNYGLFLGAVINFIVVTLFVYIIVKILFRTAHIDATSKLK
jgi:large conductance mechanosensitive channel